MISFLRYSMIYLLISATAIIIGLYSLARYGLHYSIDFTGGTVVEYSGLNETNVKKLTTAFEKNGASVSSVSKQDHNVYVVKLSEMDENKEFIIRENTLGKKNAGRILRFEAVGPSLGKETIKKTAIASLVGAIGILLYVSFTFKKLSYGLAAIIAMIHDFVILIGIYSLFAHLYGGEMDGLFVTAVLTTMSFSVHDTIVVFDKIREYKRTSGFSLRILANKALTETMVRSVNNSLTIMLMLIPLMLFGAQTLRFFSLALLIGTISGTYSSPFVATPLLVWFEERLSSHGKR